MSDGANATMCDDHVVDHLDGGKGKDWFFETLGGTLKDRVTHRRYNTVEKDKD